MLIKFDKSFNNIKNKGLWELLQDDIDNDSKDLDIIKITRLNLSILSFL